MANLKPLVEYQKIDLELKRLQNEIGKHPDLIRFEKTKSEYNAARRTVADNEENAEKIVSFYQNTLNGYAEAEAKAEELLKEFEKTPEDDETRRKEILSELEAMRSRFISIEKRLSDSRTNAENIIKNSTDARVRQKKLKEDGVKYNAGAEAFKKEREPKISELTKKLELMRHEIEPKLMEQYLQLAGDNKYPAIAEVNIRDGGKTSFCYCGLQLSQSAKAELAENGFCRCDTCRRIITQE